MLQGRREADTDMTSISEMDDEFHEEGMDKDESEEKGRVRSHKAHRRTGAIPYPEERQGQKGLRYKSIRQSGLDNKAENKRPHRPRSTN
jgi:hypothetical protein